MQHIFHIISRLDVGGAERVAINISSSKNEELSYHIVEVFRGVSPYNESIKSELQQKDITLHRALLPIVIHWHYLFERLSALLFVFRFLILWLRYRPEVIHCHTEIADMAVWVAMRVCPFVNSKVVRTIHNTNLWTGMNWIGPRVERFMQTRDANIAISGNVQEAYHRCYGQLPPIIHNGVSLTTQRPYKGIIRDKINILFAGRLEEQKGISTLCEIIRRMRADDRFHFHIFGSGRLQSEVNKLCEWDNVSINPPLHGLSAHLASFDYLIMPSLHEGLSILAIEASMNGLPVMINHCAGLYDTLPEDWPLTVHDNDIEQWTLLMNRLPDMDRASLITKAHDYAVARFSLERMQRDYEAVYLNNS